MDMMTGSLSSIEEIDAYEDTLRMFLDGKLDADRFTAARLQLGVYGQRQEGVNMVRVKAPGGRITPLQLEALADAAEQYAQVDHVNITTRQSIQLHFVPLQKTPDAMRRLAAAGLTTREACSNTIRNVTACALAGVCPREHVNVRVHVDGVMRHFLRNPLTQQMPRKFKIAFSGCESDCAQSLLHDAALVATVRGGQQGFIVKSGGGLGHKPHEAIVVDEFVPEGEVLFALEALVTLHNKYSDRTKRAKSRIKFLVERFGPDGFREKYREEFARTRDALAGKPYPRGEWRKPEDAPVPGQGAPRTLFRQHQPGRFVLPISVPLGELSVAQLRGVARAVRDAGLDEAHTTQDQNLIVPNVPQERLPALRAGLAELGLREPARGDNVVACPGNSTCRLGITSSTLVAPKLSGGLKDISIRVSGCQNGCAQPETGDIGIYGEGRRLHGKLVPHYQTYFGGSGLGGGGLGIKGPSVPAARIPQAVARVEQTYAASGAESFSAWARGQEPGYFNALLADIVEVRAEEAAEVMRDHGAAADFRVLNFGGGECAGATQVQIGATFFEAAHERQYRRALMFQRKYAEAAQCSEAILRLLGGGLVQLLDGIRQDDPSQFAARFAQHGLTEIADEFTRLAGLLEKTTEPDEAVLAPLNRDVDEWTVKVAKFCLAQDAQLDLAEALPEGVLA
jgi:sulfite reductase (ferredoxin)